MDNPLSHSLPKKTYRDNGFSTSKTVYDDVFGGPPKFGVSTLPPRLEDYTEIFEHFHSSKPSSIPILDLPVVHDPDLCFDIRTSNFDYSEVFGGFNGLDFALDYEELFNHSNVRDDSSEEAWIPAQSESLSDESDPSASSEMNRSLSNADPDPSFEITEQLKLSHDGASSETKKDTSNGMSHEAQFNAVPGSTFLVNETHPSQKIENEKLPSQVKSDHHLSTDFGGSAAGKRLRKSISQPLNTDFGTERYGSDLNPLEGHGKNSSPGNRPLLSVSDFSLKTQPSQLPPPSRPPPALASKKGDAGRLNSKLKASKSYAFERMAGESSPPYFDVEIDASSSAAASAAAMKDAVEKAQAQLRSAKELMDRKREGLQSRTKLRMENDVKDKEGRVSETYDISNNYEDGRIQGACEREDSGPRHHAWEERQKRKKTIQVVTGSIKGQKNINEAGNSVESKPAKEQKSSHGSYKTEETHASIEATQLNKMVGKKQVNDAKILEQNTKSMEFVPKIKDEEPFEQQEVGRNVQARKRRQWEDNKNQLDASKTADQWNENKKTQVTFITSHMEEELLEKPNAAHTACEVKEREERSRVSQQFGETEKTVNEADESEICENLIEIRLSDNEVEIGEKLMGGNDKLGTEKRLNDANEWKEYKRGLTQTFDWEVYDTGLKEAFEQEKCEKGLKKTLGQGAKEKQHTGAQEKKGNEKKEEKDLEKEESERRVEELALREENEKRLKMAFEHEESRDRSKMVLESEENINEQRLVYERQLNEKILQDALERKKDKKKVEEALEQEENVNEQTNACERNENAETVNHAWEKEESEKRHNKAWSPEENKRTVKEAREREESKEWEEVDFERQSIEEKLETTKWEESENRSQDACYSEQLRKRSKDLEQGEREEDDSRLNLNKENHVDIEENSKESDGVYDVDDNEIPQASRVGEHDINSGNLKTTPEALFCEEDGKLRTDQRDCEKVIDSVEWAYELVEETISLAATDHDDLQHEKANIRMADVTQCNHIHDKAGKSNEGDKAGKSNEGDKAGKSNEDDNAGKSDEGGSSIEQTPIENGKRASEMASELENANILAHNQGGGKNIKGVQFAVDPEGSKDKFTCPQVVGERVESGSNALPAMFEGKTKANNTAPKVANQSIGRKDEKPNEILREERKKEVKLQRERELENDRLRKIEEERERQREREKDRMAVDRATLEAREGAFAEARERAERAAVERASAEVRQRALAEARERLEKACAEAREKSLAEKGSMEARIRAERAAVEKATAEARERAVEKAMVDKAAFEARERAERSVADKFSASSRSSGIRQSSTSSDLPDLQFQSVGSHSGSRYSHISAYNVGENDSPQRCKARLERHQRTAERAAKALAEKNMRDLVAQKEQTERSRLAEGLDAEVKRWSSGKEGNLRALLSTLQYILGPDGGWQPVPLTEVITTVAVKKAYRKATLCVHPDKLQQRGASIQQKYICEKVFDLLKEAWNKFNSEER